MPDRAHEATDHPPDPAWDVSTAAPSPDGAVSSPGDSLPGSPPSSVTDDGFGDAPVAGTTHHVAGEAGDPSDAEQMQEMAEAFAAAADADPGLTADADPAAVAVEIDLDLARTAAERDEYLDALRRLQADFENYKKRVVRQQTEALERAGEDLVSKLLPVLDTIDLARLHGTDDALEQVAAALLDVLGKEGLERVDPGGAPFDPTEHDAVAHEEGDGDPAVAEVLRAGYRWRGRLLRPAMVKVQG